MKKLIFINFLAIIFFQIEAKECASDFHCNKDEYCSGWKGGQKPGQCKIRPGLGEMCAAASAIEFIPCKEGLYCFFDQVGSPYGKCKHCLPNNTGCNKDQYCDKGECRNRAGLGELCASSYGKLSIPCKQGLKCVQENNYKAYCREKK